MVLGQVNAVRKPSRARNALNGSGNKGYVSSRPSPRRVLEERLAGCYILSCGPIAQLVRAHP